MSGIVPKIAVIGAGLSGLVLARSLRHLADVTVFEKSKTPGGRLATRYTDRYQFDHGAQFFTSRTKRFDDFLKHLQQKGLIDAWEPRFAEIHGSTVQRTYQWHRRQPHYVVIPKMNALGRWLAEDLHVCTNTAVTALKPYGARWRLLTEQETDLGVFDWVMLAVPVQQALDLLPPAFVHHRAMSEHQMLGCYALMLGFRQPLPLAWDVALVKDADISWFSVNSTKPGRSIDDCSVVVLARNSWADAHMEDDIEQVKAYLIQVASQTVGLDLSHADHSDIHRWRYANSGRWHYRQNVQSSKPAVLLDQRLKLAACGDWCSKGRVEAAFLSAIYLASKFKSLL